MRSDNVPNLVLGAIVAGPVPVSPAIAGSFVDGVWTGTVTVLEPASEVVLVAEDSAGHAGESNPFDVQGVGVTALILTDDGHFGFSDGSFGFNVQGQAGQVVVLEVSTDLLDWLPIQTNTLGNGPFYFSDPDRPLYQSWFYRLLMP